MAGRIAVLPKSFPRSNSLSESISPLARVQWEVSHADREWRHRPNADLCPARPHALDIESVFGQYLPTIRSVGFYATQRLSR